MPQASACVICDRLTPGYKLNPRQLPSNEPQYNKQQPYANKRALVKRSYVLHIIVFPPCVLPAVSCRRQSWRMLEHRNIARIAMTEHSICLRGMITSDGAAHEVGTVHLGHGSLGTLLVHGHEAKATAAPGLPVRWNESILQA